MVFKIFVMKKKIIRLIFSISLISGIFSCSDFLEEVPKSLISPENFYQSESDAIASLYSIYDKIGSGTGVYYRWYRGLTLALSDEGWGNPGIAMWSQLNNYNYDARHTMIRDFWSFSYDAINRANATIENVPTIDMDVQKRNAIVGEARFLRALNYFNLVRFFGPVPLRLQETNSLDNLVLEASSIDLVYKEIVSDLEYAEQNMKILKRGTADANGRADLAAVKMLQAKVFMTLAGYPVKDASNWAKALAKCKELLDMKDQVGLGLWNNYLDAFEPSNENGKEDIFSIQFVSGYGAPFVGEGSLQLIDNWVTKAGRRGNYLNRPTLKLKNMFESQDKRGDAVSSFEMVGTSKYNLGTAQYVFLKYVEQNIIDENLPTNDGDKNFPLFRYSDLLLMAAEVENEVNGPTSFAYANLNAVRARAGASVVSGLSKEQFREFVLDERMRELHNEGSRWFDLIRHEILIREVTEANALRSEHRPAIPTEKNFLLPYPDVETNYNTKLQQREGY